MLLRTICIIMNVYSLINGHKLWKKVTIDNVHFLESNGSSKPPLSTSSLLGWHCGISCDQNPSCTAWCHDGQICTLTRLLISPLHAASFNTGSYSTCYTKLDSDYIVGSSVTYSSVHPITPIAFGTNLAKGIFDNVMSRTCAATNFAESDPWMLFDFGEKKPIREVRIMVAPFSIANSLAHGAQVKVGNSQPATDGDFSTFRHFGQLPSTVEVSTTYILQREAPMRGRYLSIQKIGTPLLILCYVMAL